MALDALGPENRARIYIASNRLLSKGPPQVYIGEPYINDDGNLVRRRVDALTLVRNIGLTKHEMEESAREALLTELTCHLAARRGLVLVRREGLIDEFATPVDGAPGWTKTTVTHVKDDLFRLVKDACLLLAMEDDLAPDLLTFHRLLPEHDPQTGITYLNRMQDNRLVPEDNLTPEDLGFLNVFMGHSLPSQPLTREHKTCDGRYVVKETDLVKYALNALEGLIEVYYDDAS